MPGGNKVAFVFVADLETSRPMSKIPTVSDFVKFEDGDKIYNLFKRLSLIK